jgi:hypothetical protein
MENAITRDSWWAALWAETTSRPELMHSSAFARDSRETLFGPSSVTVIRGSRYSGVNGRAAKSPMQKLRVTKQMYCLGVE